jgi:hypothetical protein
MTAATCSQPSTARTQMKPTFHLWLGALASEFY